MVFLVNALVAFSHVAFYGVKSLSQDMGTLSPSGLMGPVRLGLCK